MHPEPNIIIDQGEADGSPSKQFSAGRALQDSSREELQGLRRSARITARQNASGM